MTDFGHGLRVNVDENAAVVKLPLAQLQKVVGVRGTLIDVQINGNIADGCLNQD